MTKQRAIYLKCLDCSGDSAKEVTLCIIFDCPLWEFRCGYHISSARYKKRIKRVFAKNTKCVQEFQCDGLDIADFLKEHKHAYVVSRKREEKVCYKGKDHVQGDLFPDTPKNDG